MHPSHPTIPKAPHPVFETIFAFPPNRDTLGGTAYLIVENNRNILVDCPAWNPINQDFIHQHGGVKWLVLTHRGGSSAQVAAIQQTWNCQVLVQEQEAYLLPDLEVLTFQQEFQLTSSDHLIWTPGHSPGSACLYHGNYGGVLFTGRHLIPNQQGRPLPLRMAKTFHWPRQLRSVQSLQDRFRADTLSFICPGANIGFLRGQHRIENAYQQLWEMDLTALSQLTPAL